MDPYIPSARGKELPFADGNQFYKILSNAGFCLVINNYPVVQVELALNSIFGESVGVPF